MLNNVKANIPVKQAYSDVLSPAMKQIGKTLGNVMKVGRFILAPIDFLAAYHDRWERYLKKVSDKVKEENLIEGAPQLVIPILDGLTICQENSLISDLFVNLLANSIDSTKQDLAHPAFPNIINQLSHDEAVILYYLKKKSFKYNSKSAFDFRSKFFAKPEVLLEEFPVKELQFPHHIDLYFNHLYSLNLAGTFQIGHQEPIEDKVSGIQIATVVYQERRLTDFGELFARSCVPDEFITL